MPQKYKVLSKSSDVAPPPAEAGSGPIPASGSEIDWKAIACALYRDVEFAIQYLKGRDGSDLLVDRKTGKTRSWKDRFADNMEKIPGIKVDREAMHACGLPRKQREKWLKAREAAKSQNTEAQAFGPAPKDNDS